MAQKVQGISNLNISPQVILISPEEQTGELTLFNTHKSFALLFKIKTNKPSVFAVNPHQCCLFPGHKLVIKFKAINKLNKEERVRYQKNLQFLVQTMNINSHQITREEEKLQWKEIKQKKADHSLGYSSVKIGISFSGDAQKKSSEARETNEDHHNLVLEENICEDEEANGSVKDQNCIIDNFKKMKKNIKKQTQRALLEFIKYAFDRSPEDTWKDKMEHKLKKLHLNQLENEMRECVITIKKKNELSSSVKSIFKNVNERQIVPTIQKWNDLFKLQSKIEADLKAGVTPQKYIALLIRELQNRQIQDLKVLQELQAQGEVVKQQQDEINMLQNQKEKLMKKQESSGRVYTIEDDVTEQSDDETTKQCELEQFVKTFTNRGAYMHEYQDSIIEF